MTIQDKIRKAMNELQPDNVSIKDGPITYRSTKHTHESFKEQLNHARADSPVEYFYLLRCYDWLKLLKKNNIKMQHTIK